MQVAAYISGIKSIAGCELYLYYLHGTVEYMCSHSQLTKSYYLNFFSVFFFVRFILPLSRARSLGFIKHICLRGKIFNVVVFQNREEEKETKIRCVLFLCDLLLENKLQN